MDVAEICRLTEEAVRELMAERCCASLHVTRNGRRQTLRWPFPGTIELWIPDDHGCERHTLGTCVDLSVQGVGVRSAEQLPSGLELSIAVHQPEVSFHGRAVVRHCAPTAGDEFMIGLAFLFDQPTN